MVTFGIKYFLKWHNWQVVSDKEDDKKEISHINILLRKKFGMKIRLHLV